jgi:hypothetical protein
LIGQFIGVSENGAVSHPSEVEETNSCSENGTVRHPEETNSNGINQKEFREKLAESRRRSYVDEDHTFTNWELDRMSPQVRLLSVYGSSGTIVLVSFAHAAYTCTSTNHKHQNPILLCLQKMAEKRRAQRASVSECDTELGRLGIHNTVTFDDFNIVKTLGVYVRHEARGHNYRNMPGHTLFAGEGGFGKVLLVTKKDKHKPEGVSQTSRAAVY